MKYTSKPPVPYDDRSRCKRPYLLSYTGNSTSYQRTHTAPPFLGESSYLLIFLSVFTHLFIHICLCLYLSLSRVSTLTSLHIQRRYIHDKGSLMPGKKEDVLEFSVVSHGREKKETSSVSFSLLPLIYLQTKKLNPYEIRYFIQKCLQLIHNPP